jgi:hypothetical protein
MHSLTNRRFGLTTKSKKLDGAGLASEPCDRQPLQILSLLFNKIHPMVIQLKFRDDGRSTLDIYDEADVLYFLNSLLKIYFRDIRPEEWVRTYPSESNRKYLLLKDEQIIIRVARARNTWGLKEITEQVANDIDRCKDNPDGKTLVFFVYDPDGWIKHSKSLEAELNAFFSPQVTLKAIVEPKIYG